MPFFQLVGSIWATLELRFSIWGRKGSPKGVPKVLPLVNILAICFRTVRPFNWVRPTSARNHFFQLKEEKTVLVPFTLVRPTRAPWPFFYYLNEKSQRRKPKMSNAPRLDVGQILAQFDSPSTPPDHFAFILAALLAPLYLPIASFLQVWKEFYKLSFPPLRKTDAPLQERFSIVSKCGFANVRLLFCWQVLPFGARRDYRSACSYNNKHYWSDTKEKLT